MVLSSRSSQGWKCTDSRAAPGEILGLRCRWLQSPTASTPLFSSPWCGFGWTEQVSHGDLCSLHPEVPGSRKSEWWKLENFHGEVRDGHCSEDEKAGFPLLDACWLSMPVSHHIRDLHALIPYQGAQPWCQLLLGLGCRLPASSASCYGHSSTRNEQFLFRNTHELQKLRN